MTIRIAQVAMIVGVVAVAAALVVPPALGSADDGGSFVSVAPGRVRVASGPNSMSRKKFSDTTQDRVAPASLNTQIGTPGFHPGAQDARSILRSSSSLRC